MKSESAPDFEPVLFLSHVCVSMLVAGRRAAAAWPRPHTALSLVRQYTSRRRAPDAAVEGNSIFFLLLYRIPAHAIPCRCCRSQRPARGFRGPRFGADARGVGRRVRSIGARQCVRRFALASCSLCLPFHPETAPCLAITAPPSPSAWSVFHPFSLPFHLPFSLLSVPIPVLLSPRIRLVMRSRSLL